MNKFKLRLSVIVFIIGFILRVWDFGSNPPGLYLDEASQGYNAYSLLKTGKDEYGQPWPIFFRSFGTYPSALYGYLTTVPISVLGLEPVAIRLTSLIFGLLLIILITFWLGPVSGLVVAVAPIFIFMSRAAFEANVALTLIILALILATRSKTHPKYLPVSFVLFALSAYTYHAERFLGPAMIIYFSWILRKNLKLSLALSVLVLTPMILITFSSGVNSRLRELSSSGTHLEKISQFTSHYFSYFSPKNLFIKPDPDLQRSFPELSVFYWWMIFPFVIGLYSYIKNFKTTKLSNKSLLFLGLISVVPGALTGDYFSTLRVLPFFILVSVIIAKGLVNITNHSKITLLITVLLSLVNIYSGLVLLKHERSVVWNYEYQQLTRFLLTQKKYPVIIDNSRIKPLYILLAFHSKYPPRLIQWEYSQSNLRTYYDKFNFSGDYTLGNYQIRPIFWADDAYQTQLIVGDKLAISDRQVAEHSLRFITAILDINGNPVLNIYLTDPEAKCRKSLENHEPPNPACDKFILASSMLLF